MIAKGRSSTFDLFNLEGRSFMTQIEYGNNIAGGVLIGAIGGVIACGSIWLGKRVSSLLPVSYKSSLTTGGALCVSMFGAACAVDSKILEKGSFKFFLSVIGGTAILATTLNKLFVDKHLSILTNGAVPTISSVALLIILSNC